MSTATLSGKPLEIARRTRRTRRIRDAWTAQERAYRARITARRLNDLVAALTNQVAGDDIWAVGSLTPADLRRVSA